MSTKKRWFAILLVLSLLPFVAQLILPAGDVTTGVSLGLVLPPLMVISKLWRWEVLSESKNRPIYTSKAGDKIAFYFSILIGVLVLWLLYVIVSAS